MNLKKFLPPDYVNKMVFSRFPGMILEYFDKYLSQDRTAHLLFIFVDAFGWRFFQEASERSALLRRINRDGLSVKQHSQFPSTTACHLTTINFGMPVAETGVFEWNYFEPTVDGMISPLLYSWSYDKERDTLIKSGVEPHNIFPFESFYSKLLKKGIRSEIFQNEKYADSAYSLHAFKGASLYPYTTEYDGLSQLSKRLKEPKESTYHFIYLDSFDAAGHKEGPLSEPGQAALDKILNGIEDILVARHTGTTTPLRIMITADHGQVSLDPSKTYYLDKILPETKTWLRQNKRGELLAPGGSSRDLFLYTRPETTEEAMAQISNKLNGVAEVYRVRDLVAQGVFGERVGDRLIERLASLVILPYVGEAIWWSDNGRYDNCFRGSHGGMTTDEMEIPLLTLDL